MIKQGDVISSRLLAQLCGVTVEQLRRWQHMELIPRPTQCALGRGRGTVALYTWESIKWVQLVKILLSNQRSFDDVRAYLYAVQTSSFRIAPKGPSK